MVMSSRSLSNRQLTEIEGQAHSEAIRRFAEQVKAFSTTCEVVQRLEQDIAKIALAALTVANKPLQGSAVVTEDGLLWHKSLDICEGIYFCHRSTPHGMEYAVIEHLPAGSNVVWMKGRNAVEVLKAVAHERRRAMEAWTKETAAEVEEFLAEQYPGRDLSRVTETFMRRFTQGEGSANARPRAQAQG
jgi:hypothetical protein